MKIKFNRQSFLKTYSLGTTCFFFAIAQEAYACHPVDQAQGLCEAIEEVIVTGTPMPNSGGSSWLGITIGGPSAGGGIGGGNSNTNNEDQTNSDEDKKKEEREECVSRQEVQREWCVADWKSAHVFEVKSCGWASLIPVGSYHSHCLAEASAELQAGIASCQQAFMHNIVAVCD